jgi:predicted Holliday junction resolvase-like endonuclease
VKEVRDERHRLLKEEHETKIRGWSLKEFLEKKINGGL